MIKEKFPNLLWRNEFGKLFSRLPFKPDFYTWLSLFLGFFGLMSSYYNLIYIALLLFVISFGLDFIDGAVADALNKKTSRGAFLDGVIDRFNDFFIVFSFLFFSLPSIVIKFEYLVVILGYFTLMPTFIVAYANHRKFVHDPKERKIWRIMHRAEMYPLFLIAFFLISVDKYYTSLLLLIITILNIITTIQTIILSFKNQS